MPSKKKNTMDLDDDGSLSSSGSDLEYNEATLASTEVSDEDDGQPVLAKKETTAVNLSKSLVYIVLVIAAVAISYMAYYLTKEQEKENFEGDVSIMK